MWRFFAAVLWQAHTQREGHCNHNNRAHMGANYLCVVASSNPPVLCCRASPRFTTKVSGRGGTSTHITSSKSSLSTRRAVNYDADISLVNDSPSRRPVPTHWHLCLQPAALVLLEDGEVAVVGVFPHTHRLLVRRGVVGGVAEEAEESRGVMKLTPKGRGLHAKTADDGPHEHTAQSTHLVHIGQDRRLHPPPCNRNKQQH